uniref:uncharacterized protein LOC120347874 isoform X2 n=1 Tax=Styela clava TaxID=7725 RepID=UPI0019393126|nr:uncharacterized protein LOC120347874 isoform X2 [Styela clava]
MEKENTENDDEKSEKLEVKAEDQTTKDKDDKELGHPTCDIKVTTEDGVQQTETVTVNEQIEKKVEAEGFLEGAEAVAENPNNQQIMQVLQNIEERLDVLTETVANLQRNAVPPRQLAVGPPSSGPLAIDSPPLQPPGNELLQIFPAGCSDLDIVGGSGRNEMAMMLPRAEPLAIGPPPIGNSPSSSSASSSVGIQPSQARDPIPANRLANAPASGGVGIQAPHAIASISGNRPALSRGSNVDPSGDEQPPEVQGPSESSPSVSSVRSAAHRRFNRDRCNPF